MSNSIFFEAKAVLFREGEEATNLMIIKKGQVLCLKASKDRLIPVFLANEQDIIGESAMLGGAPHTYSAIALSKVDAISMQSDDFRQALSSAPEWITDLTTTMIARFQKSASLVAENRVLHPSIMSEEDFPPSLEIQYKKLLS